MLCGDTDPHLRNNEKCGRDSMASGRPLGFAGPSQAFYDPGTLSLSLELQRSFALTGASGHKAPRRKWLPSTQLSPVLRVAPTLAFDPPWVTA